MLRHVLRRLLVSLLLLLVLSFITYVVLVNLADPLRSRESGLDPLEAGRLRQVLGLDRQIFLGYSSWAFHFLRGNWGVSFRNTPVAPDIRDALANSLVLGFSALLLSFLAGSTFGLLSAVRQHSRLDRVVTTATLLGLSVPGFLLALLLQLFFAITLPRWLHLGGPVFPVTGLMTPGVQGFHPHHRRNARGSLTQKPPSNARHLVSPPPRSNAGRSRLHAGTVRSNVRLPWVIPRQFASDLATPAGSTAHRTPQGEPAMHS